MKKQATLFTYWLIFSALASILTILMIIIFSLSEKLSMNIAIILSLFIISLISYIYLDLRKLKHYLKHIFLFAFATFVLFQYILLAMTPNHSILSEEVLIHLGIIEKYENYEDCINNVNYENALHFFENNIDKSKISLHIINYLPFPKILKPPAAAWGNYIYVDETYACTGLEVSLYVHELTHVWQYQDGLGFGPKWVKKWINYYWLYFTDIRSLYSYGSEYDLRVDIEKGKTFREYNLEQQATLVQDYYSNTAKKHLLNRLVEPVFQFK